MLNNKLKISLLVLLTGFCLLLYNSCTKKAGNMTEKIANPSITDQQVIPDDSVNESDQDLFNVNYKEIYSDLSQHGKWIEVNGKDYGINPKEISSIEIDNKDEFLSNVFGIKNAYADADVDVGMFFVWQPDPDLTVAVAAGDVDEPPAYVPYSDGQWAYSDDNGWYFQGATPYEDVTFHYGRWVYNPYSGWVWVPGRVWAPAWVDWYEDDDYIAWCPIPPRVYFTEDVINFPPYYYYDDDRYFICDKRHFCDPDVWNYRTFYREDGDRIHLRDMHRGDGLVCKNNLVIDPGPRVKDIENHWGRNIDPVNVVRVHDKTQAGLSGNQLKSYSPQFSRINSSDRKNISDFRPKSTINYRQAASNFNNSKNMRTNQNNELAGNKSNKIGNQWNILGNMKQKNRNQQNNISEQTGKNKGNDNINKFSKNIPKNSNKNNNNDNVQKNKNSYYGSNKNKGQNNNDYSKSKGNNNNGSMKNGSNSYKGNSKNGDNNYHQPPQKNHSNDNGNNNKGGNNHQSPPQRNNSDRGGNQSNSNSGHKRNGK